MSRVVWTDRSRSETAQRCLRLRFLEYHQDGTGIQPIRKPLALCVGGSVHKGLERLLRDGQDAYSKGRFVMDRDAEDAAVAAALSDFSTHRSALARDTLEEAATAQPDPSSLATQLAATAADLGMAPTDPSLIALAAQHTENVSALDEWLWKEQASLVEGMVRAYSRRRLRPLLEEYEVLEVEREGQWELADGLYFMSRPDALLRSRTDNSLYLLSFKTPAAWDVRKARDAEHDMQGLSEGVEVERRLGERIMGIRYEYLLKGSRYEDRDLTSRFGVKTWAQRSPLVRAYQGLDETQWCWSYDFQTEEGKSSKLYYKNWRPRAVWEVMPVRRWIDMLDSATEAMSGYDSTVGLEPRPLGWKCDAQAQGYTPDHPLDSLFPPPLIVFRQDDQLRDLVEQLEAQETRVAENVAAVHAATGEGERRSLLNRYFPMTRRACEYPSTCSMSRICWGGEDIQRSPLDSGYKRRVPNHPMESQEGR